MDNESMMLSSIAKLLVNEMVRTSPESQAEMLIKLEQGLRYDVRKHKTWWATISCTHVEDHGITTTRYRLVRDRRLTASYTIQTFDRTKLKTQTKSNKVSANHGFYQIMLVASNIQKRLEEQEGSTAVGLFDRPQYIINGQTVEPIVWIRFIMEATDSHAQTVKADKDARLRAYANADSSTSTYKNSNSNSNTSNNDEDSDEDDITRLLKSSPKLAADLGLDERKRKGSGLRKAATSTLSIREQLREEGRLEPSKSALDLQEILQTKVKEYSDKKQQPSLKDKLLESLGKPDAEEIELREKLQKERQEQRAAQAVLEEQAGINEAVEHTNSEAGKE